MYIYTDMCICFYNMKASLSLLSAMVFHTCSLIGDKRDFSSADPAELILGTDAVPQPTLPLPCSPSFHCTQLPQIAHSCCPGSAPARQGLFLKEHITSKTKVISEKAQQGMTGTEEESPGCSTPGCCKLLLLLG